MNESRKVDIISSWGRAVTPENVKTVFDYPRPQLVRGDDSWHSLNGLWEFEACPEWGCGPPPFGRTLNETILVPFPVGVPAKAMGGSAASCASLFFCR
jgi:hypothetical protein